MIIIGMIADLATYSLHLWSHSGPWQPSHEGEVMSSSGIDEELGLGEGFPEQLAHSHTASSRRAGMKT